MNNIIYEDNHLIIVEKKANTPTQQDETNDLDLLTILKNYIKEKYNKPGNVYLGLVHRLDRPVGGVMVFAKTSKAASRLSKQIKEHTFKKEYYAIIIGNMKQTDTLIDKLYKDSKTNIVSVNEKGKEAILEYEIVETKDELSLVKINLKTGRSHQIRVQFASRNHPLYGDQKYNEKAIKGEQIALYATSITLVHPITNIEMTFKTKVMNKYPWNMFKQL